MSGFRSMNVLIVDDEHLIADTLRVILANRGYDAYAAYSGEQALESARKHNPDVLIMDVLMDGISGVEAAVRISAEVPDCRVILVSGYGGAAELLERAADLGDGFELLPKPVHPEFLLDLLTASPATASMPV